MMPTLMLMLIRQLLLLGTAAATTSAPVIGILAVPTIDGGGCITARDRAIADAPRPSTASPSGSCFDSLYPQWVAAAGGRVVPIRYDAPPAELARLFRSVNGVLFTGGETDIRLLNSTYMLAAKQLFDLAAQAHASGDHVPLWGTCMGFQTLAILAAGRADALTSRGFDADGISLPLVWTAAYRSQFARGLATANGVPSAEEPTAQNTPALAYLTNENITTNLHHDGVEPSSFTRIKALGEFFAVVSTNRDLKGKEFVSTMEAASGAPIYGTQWHPERNAYQFSLSADEDDINHSLHAIHTMQTVANFFVVEARRNSHAFASERELQDALLYNYDPVGPQGDSYRAYNFPPFPSAASAGLKSDDVDGTCDFRLAESTRFSGWTTPLGALGVSTNTTVNINGEFLGSGNSVSLAAFLAQDAAVVREMVRSNVLPMMHGGASTTVLLVIDIETPARPDSFYAMNDTTLRRVVAALRLRVAVLKQVMPRCTVSFYGAPTRLYVAKALPGYRRASALGLFDDVDYSTPSLYLSPGQDPANVTSDVLRCAAEGILRSDGTPVPLAPFLSWVYEGQKGGRQWHCALSAAMMRTQLDLLERAGKARVPIIAWFNGYDNKTDLCGGFQDQLEYMQRNDFVPSRCRV